MNERLTPLHRARTGPAKARTNQPNGGVAAAKPRLFVDKVNPHNTVAELRNILAAHSGLYERNGPVRLVHDPIDGGVVARSLTAESVMRLAHDVCRPFVKRMKAGEEVEADAPLTRPFAVMYLDMHGEWNLPVLNGVVSAPLLGDDGTISVGRDYDSATGLWCDAVPDLRDVVPEWPNAAQAAQALAKIREKFRTFCFADSPKRFDGAIGVEVVDTSRPPGQDESAFLTALLTAVCRASLDFAPGFLFRGAALSGAGTGKGLLARCTSAIAFGRRPHAVTRGRTEEEFEKRMAAELIQGHPMLFFDNLNDVTVKSDLLASALTERPARVRVLGKSENLTLNATCFVVLTGNGISVSEDLARRFLVVEFDAGMEDPESRSFPTDLLAEVLQRRRELLAAALTVWRWGRQSVGLPGAKPLGGFERWCRWVRDPLVALGCNDPVERIAQSKQRDGLRAVVGDLYAAWWAHHADRPIKLRDLHEEVRRVVDPQGRGRQFVAAHLESLTGTRTAGFVLTRQVPPGKYGVATYALKPSDARPAGVADAPDAPDAVRPSNIGGDDAIADNDSAIEETEPNDVFRDEVEEHRDHRGDSSPPATAEGAIGCHAPDAPDAVAQRDGVVRDPMPLMPLMPCANAAANTDEEEEWEDRA